MGVYVLVHGAWHTGELLEDVAEGIRAEGHTVWCPTLKGNAPGDAKDATLDDAIDGLVAYFAENAINDAVMVGHSYGGMVITGAYDRLPEGAVRRLVYWSAFVPNDGECLEDMVPPNYVALFGQLEGEDGSVMLPPPIWREAFINDADAALADAAFAKLNPHPHATFTQKISLKSNPAEWQVGKSYIHCQSDMALPGSMPWHPRLSEKLGLYRYVWMEGSHEVSFTNPRALAAKMIEAGRD